MPHQGRIALLLLMVLLALAPLTPAHAQDTPVYPLPADLFILTSEQRVLRIDATTGEQTAVSPEGQPVAAFDIAPGGGWYAYRTLDNQAVIVSSLNELSGFVVEFDQPLPAGDAGQSIAWSPDGARLAYTVPEGVRVANLPSFGMGEPAVTTVQGGPWTDLYWIGDDALIAVGADGAKARISGGPDAWQVEPSSEPTARHLPVDSRLIPEGVQLADARLVPGTAGALAFDWNPLSLPELPPGRLPADLYFLALDDAGVAQVWRLPLSGEPARAVTSGDQPVIAYAVAGGRVAAITASELRVAPLDGGAAQTIAMVTTGRTHPYVAFSDDGSQLAFSDDRGLWTVPADGSQTPRLAVPNVLEDEPGNIRVYLRPRWNNDATRLLVMIGLYEGAMLGVVDLASGAVTELPSAISGRGLWMVDGRVATYGASFGYSRPGLYVLDPAAPEAEPLALLGPDTPVFDAAQRADGVWAVIAGNSAEMGPQWMRLRVGSEERGFITRDFDDTGAFIERPELAPITGMEAMPTVAAGLRNASFGPDGFARGELTVADLSTGEAWSAPAPAPVSQVQWAP